MTFRLKPAIAALAGVSMLIPLAADGMDITNALANIMGLKPDIVSSTFDSIVPSVGSSRGSPASL